MENSKSWWRSTTVISGLVALLGGIGTFFGYELAPADQAELVEIIAPVLVFVGSIGAIVGRFRASKKIGKAE